LLSRVTITHIIKKLFFVSNGEYHEISALIFYSMTDISNICQIFLSVRLLQCERSVLPGKYVL
jgi:hypothetical protein